jgi:hypothetical protein
MRGQLSTLTIRSRNTHTHTQARLSRYTFSRATWLPIFPDIVMRCSSSCLFTAVGKRRVLKIDPKRMNEAMHLLHPSNILGAMQSDGSCKCHRDCCNNFSPDVIRHLREYNLAFLSKRAFHENLQSVKHAFGITQLCVALSPFSAANQTCYVCAQAIRKLLDNTKPGANLEYKIRAQVVCSRFFAAANGVSYRKLVALRKLALDGALVRPHGNTGRVVRAHTTHTHTVVTPSPPHPPPIRLRPTMMYQIRVSSTCNAL